VEGDTGILKQLASTMVEFDPRFEIMPGTKAMKSEVAGYVESGILGATDPYQAVTRQTIAE
jgi:linear primary-alkylsulfatase